MLTNHLPSLEAEREHGFTLVEVLIVVVIIGILSAIAVPAFLNQRKSGVDAAVKGDIKTTALAIKRYLVSKPHATIPDFTVSYSTASADSPVGTLDVSDGTTIQVTGNPTQRGQFTIRATNPGGGAVVSGEGYFYDSAKGGLKNG